MTSIIFVTLKDGMYANHWSSDARDGVRELTWEGQRSGRRDEVAQPGTLVAVRPNSRARYFDIVGKIAVKTSKRSWQYKRPAEYKLQIEMYRVPTRVERDSADAFTHNNVLRTIGLPIEKGAVPHGIYG